MTNGAPEPVTDQAIRTPSELVQKRTCCFMSHRG